MMDLYVTHVEISQNSELEAKVTFQDENCVEVDLRQKVHTLESWRELSGLIERAIVMMDLK